MSRILWTLTGCESESLDGLGSRLWLGIYGIPECQVLVDPKLA